MYNNREDVRLLCGYIDALYQYSLSLTLSVPYPLWTIHYTTITKTYAILQSPGITTSMLYVWHTSWSNRCCSRRSALPPLPRPCFPRPLNVGLASTSSAKYPKTSNTTHIWAPHLKNLIIITCGGLFLLSKTSKRCVCDCILQELWREGMGCM